MCGIIAYINSSIDCYNIIYNGLKQLQNRVSGDEAKITTLQNRVGEEERSIKQLQEYVNENRNSIGMLEEDLKTWSYNDPNGLSERQLALFKHLYSEYAVDEIVGLMGNELYKQQRAYKPVQEGTANPKVDTGKL